jgi:hypothetical protein
VPRSHHIAKTYSSGEERIVHITKRKKQINSMSDSGANQDKLAKQINGILKSGKVTQEEMQAIIESLGKKNKPVKKKKHKKSSTGDMKSPMPSLLLLSSLLLSSKAKASSKASPNASSLSSAKKEPKSLSLMVLKGDSTSDPPKMDVELHLQADSREERKLMKRMKLRK